MLLHTQLHHAAGLTQVLSWCAMETLNSQYQYQTTISVRLSFTVENTCHDMHLEMPCMILLTHLEGLHSAGNAIWVLLKVLQAVAEPDGGGP